MGSSRMGTAFLGGDCGPLSGRLCGRTCSFENVGKRLRKCFLSSDSLTVIHGLSFNIGSEIGIKTFSIREFRKESIRLLSQICEWLRAHKDEPGGLGVQRAAGRRC